MKKNRLFLIAAGLVAALSFTACHKHDHDDHDPSDNSAPNLVINTPAANSSIAGAVSITGNISDNSLHALYFRVVKDSDGSELFAKTVSVHNKTSFDFNETWTPAGIADETGVTLTVRVEDHGDNQTAQSVQFKVKP